MHVLVQGSGGSCGWPEPGCRCASCLRGRASGTSRDRSAIVVDGVLRLAAGETPEPTGAGAREPTGAGAQGLGAQGAGAAGFGVRRLADARDGAGGWDVTSPDGERLLYPAGPGAAPDPPAGTTPYDVAFLDMLGDPAQLGGLRARGLVTADTVTAVAFADHRVSGPAELERRCGLWRVAVPVDGEWISTGRSAQGFKSPGGAAPWRPWRVVVIGGARSGKSEWAELRLAGEAEVTYVATAPSVPRGGDGDREWAARVAAHRARRPAWWRTAETTDLAGVLAAERGAVLIDGIGTWLTAVLDECDAWGGADGARAKVAERIAEFVAAWRQARGLIVAVSDEAGMGVVPATAAGRLFRDELGRLNQVLTAESEEAELVLAGRVLPLNGG